MTELARRDLRRLPLDAITLDPELQPRAKIDRDVLEDYGQHLVDGGALPPVLVVADPARVLWLADGYHRWHAHKALGFEAIAAEVRLGTRADALRLSLAANAEHGKRREPGDLRRAYGIAVEHGLVQATDVEGVAALIRCSGSWAEKLTQDAREAARAARDAAIRAGKAAGKSNRVLAAEVGRGGLVFAVDPKGGHLLALDAWRKLLDIRDEKGQRKVLVRLISEGKFDDQLARAGVPVATVFSADGAECVLRGWDLVDGTAEAAAAPCC